MFKQSFGGYTGGMLENELFNKTERKENTPSMEMYVKYHQAMNIVKRSQPFEDPSDPEPVFANDLHATIADKLNLEDYGDLKFYTAVGSHLDQYHKVDAFFDVKIAGRTITVTLDVTMNTQKGEDYNTGADVVFVMPNEGLDPKLDEDKEAYKEKIDEVADRIVRDINNKLI